MATLATAVTRSVLGEPLRSDRLDEQLLPKRLALPVFCSDPLSSVAYATEQIILVLGLGGLALLHLTSWVAAAVVALLAIVVASYRQTCVAYPNGGGAYAVSRENLGEDASLVAASALLIDYVLTVAVSVVAGVAAITSAVPELADHAVALSLGFVVVLTVMNLRGVKESGRAFAVPTSASSRPSTPCSSSASPRSCSATASPPRAPATTSRPPPTPAGCSPSSSSCGRSRRAARR